MTISHAVECKDSGVSWIGTLPSDWEVKPAKALFSNPSEPSLSTDVHLTPSQKYGVLPQVEYMEITGSRVVLNLSGGESMRHVEAGDFVSHLRSFQGGLEYSTYSGKVSNAYTVLRPRNDFNHRFFQYLFKSNMYVQGLQTTTDQLRDGQSIRYGQFALLPLPFPPREQQDETVEYLDRETAQIDALIEKQKQLVETLEERRLSVISRAVTYGLESETSYQTTNSITWPEVPVSWKVIALKHLLEIPMTDGPHETPEFLDDGVEFISAEAVSQGVINFDKKRSYISESDHARFSRKYFPRLHDIYVIKSGATTGRSAILTEEREFNIWSPLAVVRASPEVDPFFLHFVIQSEPFQKSIELSWSFGTQQNIGMGVLQNLQVPLPPHDEQIKIRDHILFEIRKIDALVEKSKSMIEVVSERRQALISAAVTGKIDVRGK